MLSLWKWYLQFWWLLNKLFLNCGLQRTRWESSANSPLGFQNSLTAITFSQEQLILVRNECLHNFEERLLGPLWNGGGDCPVTALQWSLRSALDIDPLLLSVNIFRSMNYMHSMCTVQFFLPVMNIFNCWCVHLTLVFSSLAGNLHIWRYTFHWRRQ